MHQLSGTSVQWSHIRSEWEWRVGYIRVRVKCCLHQNQSSVDYITVRVKCWLHQSESKELVTLLLTERSCLDSCERRALCELAAEVTFVTSTPTQRTGPSSRPHYVPGCTQTFSVSTVNATSSPRCTRSKFLKNIFVILSNNCWCEIAVFFLINRQISL